MTTKYRPQLVADGHIPTIAEMGSDTPTWGVMCHRCSQIAEDYVWPCREGVDYDVPAELVAAPTAAPKATVTLPALPSCTRDCPGVMCDHPKACPLDAGSGEPYRQPCGCLTNDDNAHRGDCPDWERIGGDGYVGPYWAPRAKADSGETEVTA